MPSMSDLHGIRVLLLEGSARQGMPLMQALHDLGCHITTYNRSRLDLGYASRYPDDKVLAYWDTSDPDGCLEGLRNVLKQKKIDVVIPTTDFAAILLSRHKDELRQYAAIAVNEWDIFQKSSDKQQTMMICMQEGIPCPRTISDVDSLDGILASGIEYPFIIKPRTSYGSIGFHRIESEDKLRQVFPRAVEQYGKMVVQEYIPQTDVQFGAEFFVDGDGNIKSACVFNKSRWYPVDGGSTCCSATIDRPDIVESCSRLLKTIGWRGYADVDLIQDPRDGVAKIMEINPRVTASVKICFVAGVDFARQILELETGREVSEFIEYRKNVKLRYMHTDLLWFIQSPKRFQANPSWFRFGNTVDQIWSWKDPLPWFTYSLQAVRKLSPELQKRKR